MDERYDVKIIVRDGMGQTSFLPSLSRVIVACQSSLVQISRWRWWLRWQTRRVALDRAFRSADRCERKLARKDQYRR